MSFRSFGIKSDADAQFKNNNKSKIGTQGKTEAVKVESQANELFKTSIKKIDMEPEMSKPAVFHKVGSRGGWGDWKPKAPEAGVNPVGKEGGFYTDLFSMKTENDKENYRRVMFKQDPVIAKNIAEVVAGKLMRALADETLRNQIAQVEFARANDSNEPDEDGTNIYVCSVLFKRYHDLYKDAACAVNTLEKFQNARNYDKSVPQRRPSYGKKTDIRVKDAIEAGRYLNLSSLITLEAFIDNPDVHYANIGAIPADRRAESHHYHDPQSKESYKIYDKVKAVILDFGGAFGDDRPFKPRKFDGKLHFRDFFRYYPSHSGPPNYFHMLPKSILETEEHYKTLANIALVPEEYLEEQVKKIMAEVSSFYGPQPMWAFAKRIGAPLSLQHRGNPDQFKKQIEEDIGNFLFDCLRSRQVHAYELCKKEVGRINRKASPNNAESDLKDHLLRLRKNHSNEAYNSINKLKIHKKVDQLRKLEKRQKDESDSAFSVSVGVMAFPPLALVLVPLIYISRGISLLVSKHRENHLKAKLSFFDEKDKSSPYNEKLNVQEPLKEEARDLNMSV